jgi:hypothetical protein
LQRLGVRDNRSLPDFEVLFRIGAVDAAPRDARVLAVRKK